MQQKQINYLSVSLPWENKPFPGLPALISHAVSSIEKLGKIYITSVMFDGLHQSIAPWPSLTVYFYKINEEDYNLYPEFTASQQVDTGIVVVHDYGKALMLELKNSNNESQADFVSLFQTLSKELAAYDYEKILGVVFDIFTDENDKEVPLFRVFVKK